MELELKQEKKKKKTKLEERSSWKRETRSCTDKEKDEVCKKATG